MIEGALVLKGDSLRDILTSGVLDVMMEQGIKLSYVNGISAGFMCEMNYLSKQVRRTLQTNTEYPHDKRYMSFRNMLKNRLIFNSDFLFGELSTELVPLDLETFESSPQKFEVVATKCRTDRPVLFEKGVCTDMYVATQASCSMPVLSGMITVEDRRYLDGDISLPITYKRAMELDYEKVVVILTRQHDYRKRPVDQLTKRDYDRYLEPLPELRATLEEVSERYDRMQEEMGKPETDGKLFIIRPKFPVMASRVERNAEKLRTLYTEGWRIREERPEALREYLGI